MLGGIRFVLIAAALSCAAPSAFCAPLSPEGRTKVESAIAFLAKTGDPGDLDTAARLRNMLDDGKIEVGVPGDAADKSSLAWAEDGVIYINQDRIGRPKPVQLDDYTKDTRQNWEQAFDLAATLVHELKHIESDTSVVGSNVRHFFGGANPAELEGWREGSCAAVRWLDALAAQLPQLPPAERAELAWRLGDSVNSLSSGLNDFVKNGYLGGKDFSEAQWCKPGGGVFSTQAEAEQFFADYLAKVQKIGADANAELKPQGYLGDGDGPHFCCQWWIPFLKTQTCAPGKNRPLCLSYEQGKAVDNADCVEVAPGVPGCKPR